jgi:hypothetical protein
MKILPFEQGSVEWMRARAGIPTASEFDNIISPTWKIRTGEMPKSYLAAKLAEAWRDGPLIGFNVFDVEQGRILEEEARPWLELELDTEIARVGLCTRDDGRVGCSPDGIIWGEDEGCGVEIKCPQPTAHVKYLLRGEVPPEYLAQVHGGMYVTGFKEWKFLSYSRGFPKLLLTVELNEDIQTAIHEAVEAFLREFDVAFERLYEINGGPPKRRPVVTPKPEPKPEEFQEIIP